jgi:8-amino-7-oxononanoate synthase
LVAFQVRGAPTEHTGGSTGATRRLSAEGRVRLEVHSQIEPVQTIWDSLAPRSQVGLESRHLKAIERSGINAIEPFYILASEQGRAVGIAYCFAMNIDLGFLDKELPPETIRTLRAWHPGFLKARILECGFVSGLGEAIAARNGDLPLVSLAVAREMERIGRETKAEFILIRDVPYERYADYAGLTREGFRPLLGFPIARMRLRWSSLDGYLQDLKATSRWRVRHMLSRRSPDLESAILPSFGEHAARLMCLWSQTHSRASDYSHEELNEAYFQEIDRQLGERSLVVALTRKGRIVAFSLCLLGDDEYFSSHAGLDYQAAGDDNLHFCLSMAVLEDALRRKLRTINRGITTYDVKFAAGFEAEPQVYLAKHIAQPRLTVSIARRLQEAMPQPENTHRPFRDQDVAQRPNLNELAARLARTQAGPDVFDKAHGYDRADSARLSGVYGFFPPFESAQGPVVQYHGKPVVMLGSNAYLGLGTHPEVIAAARRAVARYGTGCSGSPLLNGTLDIHAELARELAAFMGKEDAILCTTGYQTNVGAVSALLGKNDVVIMDRLDHASLVDGARLANAEVIRFRHNDMESLDDALRKYPDRARLVVVDSVFSMEGTIANLPAIVDLVRRHGARLFLDEAHAVGVLGPGGRGAAEMYGVLDGVDLIMGTFSKSFASVGGFVAGDAKVIDYLRHVARAHMFSASLPPASVAAARAALEIIKREPERRARVLANAEYLARRLQELGYEAPYRGTAIVPVHCGRDILAYGLFKKLLDEGVFVNPVAEPAVPRGHELLRTSCMATHDRGMLDRAADIFARLRTEWFPKKSTRAVRLARPQPSLRVRPMVFLPVADRDSLSRYYVAGSQGGLLRVPGFTRLAIGQSVDCGISFGRENVIVQSQGRIVSKRLVPRPGRPLGIEVELLPTEARARDLIRRILEGEGGPVAGRRCWRYHAGIDVEYLAEGSARTDIIDDISLEGAAIRNCRHVACGSQVRLRLKEPSCPPIEVAGEVRWRSDGDAPAFGVQFQFGDSSEREHVRVLIGRIKDAMADPGFAEVAVQ